MRTCIPSHRLKRSWCSCPRWINAGNRNTPGMHHWWRWHVTTSKVGLRWHTQKFLLKIVNPRDIAWNTADEVYIHQRMCINSRKKACFMAILSFSHDTVSSFPISADWSFLSHTIPHVSQAHKIKPKSLVLFHLWCSQTLHIAHRGGGPCEGLAETLEQLLFVGWLTSQQHASVSQGRICSDNFTCCHTEIEAADPTFYLTQSQYTDTGLTSPSADPVAPGTWQGSQWSANF